MAETGDDEPDVSAPFDRGTPGRSAEAEYRRRRARDEQRRKERLGRLAWLATLLYGERQSTRAWSTGAHGERQVAAELERALGDRGIVLHDRRLPGSPANIDHIAVAPSGVWVVDAKEHRGRVERRDVGGWLRTDRRLYVGSRDRSKALDGVRRQRETVQRMLELDFGADAPPLRSAVCIVGATWSWWARQLSFDGVVVAPPHRLGRMLLRPELLGGCRIEEAAAAVARRFPVR